MCYRSLFHVLDSIAVERKAQHEKWGEQHHPDGTASEDFKTLCSWYRQECDRKHKAGEGTWTDILLEEVYEAAAEEEWSKLRKELVQVAAVCVAWIQDGDQRG